MCVAIVKPANVDFPKELFEAAWRKNPHGGGYMYAADGKVIVRKGFMDLEAMMQDYEANKASFGDSPVILHFRIKTHGPIAPDQTHPHAINDRLAFVHNGVISIEIPKESTNSDTMEFNDRVLKNLPEGFTKDPYIMELVRGYVNPSRLVFLDADKNITIVNEKSGCVDPQGRWHSNEGAMAAVDPKYQRDSYYEILGSRSDPDIFQWKGLSKKAQKRLRKKARRGETIYCAGCNRALSDWEAEDGTGYCYQCTTNCRQCGQPIHPRLMEATGVNLCANCMTEDERAEVADILGDEDEEAQFHAAPYDAANQMMELVLDLESGWETMAGDMDAPDYDKFMTEVLKGFTEFTAWLRDNGDKQMYADLLKEINRKPRSKARELLDKGYDELLKAAKDKSSGGGSSAKDEWEEFEFNPPETGRLFLIS